MEERRLFASQSHPHVPLCWKRRAISQAIRSDVQQASFAESLNFFARVLSSHFFGFFFVCSIEALHASIIPKLPKLTSCVFGGSATTPEVTATFLPPASGVSLVDALSQSDRVVLRVSCHTLCCHHLIQLRCRGAATAMAIVMMIVMAKAAAALCCSRPLPPSW
jgi:hypothetical protein